MVTEMPGVLFGIRDRLGVINVRGHENAYRLGV